VSDQAWIAMLLPGLPAMLRAAGAALLVPAFTGMPGSIRAGLVLIAAVVAWPMGSRGASPEGSFWLWAPQELAAGAIVGATAAAAAGGLRLAGRLVGEQMGLGLGEAAQPESAEPEGNAAEATLGWCSAACFVAVGGIETVVITAARGRDGQSAWGMGAEGIASALDAASAPGVMTLAGGFGVRAATGLGMLAATAVGVWAAQTEVLRGVLARLAGGAS